MRQAPALLVLLLLAVPAAAQFVANPGPDLVAPTTGPVAVWNGSEVLVFGGLDSGGGISTVSAWPSGTILNATLPDGLADSTGVWAEGSAYLFGGFEGTNRSRAVVEYDPDDDAVYLAGLLPRPLNGASAVWTGAEVLVFGGHDGTQGHRDVYSFDPVTRELTMTGGRLPAARWGMSAVWDDVREQAYLFGGTSGPGDRHDSILRYDPVRSTFTTLEVALPTPRQDTAAVWDGQRAWIIGGFDGDILQQVLHFTPRTGALTAPDVTLPEGRTDAAAVWDGDRVLVLGGTFQGPVADVVALEEEEPADPDEPVPETPTRTYAPVGRTGNLTAGFSYLVVGGDDDLVVDFRDASNLPGGAIRAWRWDFGDGTTSDLKDPLHRFPAADIYRVSLTVTGGDATATTSERIRVGDQTPDETPPEPAIWEDPWVLVGGAALLGLAISFWSLRGRY